MGIAKVSGDEFKAMVLDVKLPVVVDFYATWCGPCKMVAPVLEELAGTFGDKVRFVKVDIDDDQEIAEQFAISGVPTLVMFKGGNEADRKVGALPRPALEDWVKNHVK